MLSNLGDAPICTSLFLLPATLNHFVMAGIVAAILESKVVLKMEPNVRVTEQRDERRHLDDHRAGSYPPQIFIHLRALIHL